MADTTGSVGVEVYPDASGWISKLEAQILPQTAALGDKAGAEFQRAFEARVDIGRSLASSVDAPLQDMEQKAGDAFARMQQDFTSKVTSKIDAAIRDLPDLKVDADTDPAMAKLVGIREELSRLSDDVKLGVEDGDTFEKLDRIAAELVTLGAESPDIHVQTDALAAAAQFAALSREINATADAEAKATTASDAFTRSYTDRLDKALKSLPDIQVNADTSDADRKLAALRAGLEDLRQNVTLGVDDGEAEAKLAALKAQLLDLGKTSEDIRIKTDAAAAASDLDVVAQKAQNARQQFSLLQDVILPLAPAAAALGGAALAAGAGLAALGGVGELAFKGVQTAMTQATGEGQAFNAGVQAVQGDLTTLEGVAARGILSPFQAAVKDLGGAMPLLSTQTAILSGYLGDIAGKSIDGLVGGFRAFGPLLDSAAAEADKIARVFDQWANGPGGQKFAAGLQSAFDEAVPAIENLAGTAAKLVAAMQPLGTSTLSGIRLLSEAINSIPLGVLTGLVDVILPLYEVNRLAGYFDNLKTSIGGLSGAGAILAPLKDALASIQAGFSNAGDAEGFIGKLGAIGSGAAEAAAGLLPLGLAAGGIGGILGLASVAFGQYQQHQAELASETASLTSALEQSGDAFDSQAKSIVANALAGSDAANQATALGLSLSTLNGALTGNKDDMGQVNDAINKATAAYNSGTETADQYGTVTHHVSDSVRDNYNAATALKGAIDDQSGSIGKASEKAQQYLQMTTQSTTAAYNWNDATKTTANSLTTLATATGLSAKVLQTYAQDAGFSAGQIKAGVTTNAQLASAVQQVEAAAQSAGPSMNALLSQMGQFSQSAGTAADKAALFGAELQASMGDALTTDQTVADLYHNIDGLKTAFDTAGKGAISFKTGAVDLANVNSGPLLDSLSTVQQGLIKAFEAQYQYNTEIGQDGQTAANNAVQSLNSQVTAFQKQASAAGLSKQAVQDLTAKYFNIPASVETKIEQQGGETVEDVLISIRDYLHELVDPTWKPTIGANTSQFDQANAATVNKLNAMDRTLVTPTANLNHSPFDAGATATTNKLNAMDRTIATPAADLNKSNFDNGATAVADEMNNLNRLYASPTITANTTSFYNATAGVEKTLDSINGRVVGTTITTTQQTIYETQGRAITSANGNILNGAAQPLHFAQGGELEDHIAQIAPASNTPRIWGEAETGGEAYIPLAPSKRERSTEILAEVARQFGYGQQVTNNHQTTHTTSSSRTVNMGDIYVTPSDPSAAVTELVRRIQF